MNSTQKCILDVFKEATQICDRHNIPYFAIGGTAIGAVRHNGFIPWDDDLDIAIPIEYYSDFFRYADKELSPHYYTRTGKNHKYHMNIFGKILDKRTMMIDDFSSPDEHLYGGVFIDVMPIAGLPSGKMKRSLFVHKLNLYNRLNQWCRCSPECYKEKKTYLLQKTVHNACGSRHNDLFFNKVFRQLEKRPLSGSEWTGYTWSHQLNKRKIFSAEWFRGTIDVPFEDTVIKCPVGVHEMLKTMFGDYMRIPSEDEHPLPHGAIVDLNTSYKVYIDKKKKGMDIRS